MFWTCRIDNHAPRPLPTSAVTKHHLGMQQAEGGGASAHNVRQQRRLPQRGGSVNQSVAQDGTVGGAVGGEGRGWWCW